jgi:hypothetical protein
VEIRGAIRVCLLAAAAATVAACSSPGPVASPTAPASTPAPAADTRVAPLGGQTVPRSDPADQFIVAGQTVDATGTPEGGLEVYVVAQPAPGTQVGNVRQETAIVWTQADAEGRFDIHLHTTEALQTIAAANGEYVNFMVYAFSPADAIGAREIHGMGAFPLRWSGDAFTELPTDAITLKAPPGEPAPGDPTPPAGG